MSANTADRGRITARLTAYAQQVIERAAELTATTTNQFVAQAAFKEAQKILEDERVVRLSDRDAAVFFEALENPKPLNQRMAASLLQHLEASSESRNRVSTVRWTPRPR